MSLDYEFSGPPGTVESPSNGLGLGADNFNNTLWLISSNGNIPVTGGLVSKIVKLGQTANIASLLVYTAPFNGLFYVAGYVNSTVATSGTNPSMTVVYTDADTSGTITATAVTGGSTSAANTVYQGGVYINAKAGTTVTLATTSYATTTYNVKARIVYMG